MRRLIRIASWLYPAAWRQRYGAEFEALLEDVRPAGRDVWDVVRGALIMQMTAWNFGRVLTICGLAGLIVAGAIAYMMPADYVSTAVMRIAPMPIPEGTSQEAANMQTRERLQLMQQEILSRSSLTGMIVRPSLDLYRKDRTSIPLEDVVQDMRHKIRIQPVGTAGANGSATAFSISYEYPNKFKAQAAVRELVTKFTEVNVTQQRAKGQAPGTGGETLEVLDPASLPSEPISPNWTTMLLLGLVAGLLVGLIAALVLAWPKPAIAIAAFGIGGCVVVAAVSFLIPDQYISSAVLRADPAAATAEQLLDPDVLARVVAAQDVVKSVEELRRHLTISGVNTSIAPRVFVISYKSGNRFEAQKVVRQMVSELNSKQLPARPVEVLDPASDPMRPSGPNRLVMSMLGLLGGLVFGTLTVTMRTKRTPAVVG